VLKAGIKTVELLIYKYNFVLKKSYWLLSIVIIASLNIRPTFAQDSNKIAINSDSLGQPMVIRGISGGSIKALEITHTENSPTGYCDGFASRQPNHVLTIDTFFDYLRLEVESSADTTILVKGAGGIWCNDDAGSANPMIEGQWQPGIYRVWVGSYQANSSNNYQIKITDK